ncbi:hypothetical protein QBC44DRAFT_62038 [Cladorrhinum sp. PSN332]|nr:hypothetical protein QBC44DRAFT_62038 [Cladorrhinum sp. PSN332]
MVLPAPWCFHFPILLADTETVQSSFLISSGRSCTCHRCCWQSCRNDANWQDNLSSCLHPAERRWGIRSSPRAGAFQGFCIILDAQP